MIKFNSFGYKIQLEKLEIFFVKKFNNLNST